jgi:D-alanyl-D-alanine carboxypeptidase/D-alanyl-D-alanine-endopeptidase (penicillin-binding protein 4)
MARRPFALSVLAALSMLVACTASAAASPSSGGRAGGQPGNGPGDGSGFEPQIGTLPPAAAAIMAKPEYRNARWVYSVVDAETGKTLLANRPDELVFTASTAKNFTVGSAYATLGTDFRYTTPVYTTATPAEGVLDGDLVLVASGDPALGGRGATEGRVDQAFTATTIDHVYGDLAPNAAVVPDDPLAGLDDLARQVAASGITTIEGDVTIDTRLWDTFETQEASVTPIFVNDNILDLMVTGTEPGRPATVELRPQTEAITVTSTVTTTDATTPTSLEVTPDPADPTSITVSGTIVGGTSQLTIYRVPDPASWARTLFIEALGRAGVTVTAPATRANDETTLPVKDSYAASDRVASLTSPPLAAFGRMILETSYNTGANAVLCVLAAHTGSTDCLDGLKAVYQQIGDAGLDPDAVFLIDGQGADPASTTSNEMVGWMRWALTQPWGAELEAAQPVLGVSGTLAAVGHDSPAQGKVAAKTGTSASLDPTTGRAYYKVQSLAGYMTTDSGEKLVFALSMSGGTYRDLATALQQSNADVSGVAAAFQQALSAPASSGPGAE